jgi:hypothetical protein
MMASLQRTICNSSVATPVRKNSTPATCTPLRERDSQCAPALQGRLKPNMTPESVHVLVAVRKGESGNVFGAKPGKERLVGKLPP